MENKQVNYDFARAWDLNQGSFAKGIAEKLLTYAEDNNKKINSVYDVCCGASNLLSVFEEKGITCFGTETRQGMHDYSKEMHPKITYFLTDKMYELPGKEKVDLITCTHDIVNYFETFDEWEEFFENVEKRLDKKGIFHFDFYTKYKLQDWNETTFKSSDYLDCLMNVKSGMYDKTILTYTYYISYQNHHVKTKDIVVESYYPTQQILDALKKAGFKRVLVVDGDLNPLENTEYAERIHILAFKK